MKRTDWKYLVDTLLFICMFGISFIGILLGFAMPKGPSAQESAKYFLGLHRHQWGDIHLYLSLAFILIVIIHLFLSWSWIKGKARALFNKGWRIILTLTVISACLVLGLFWLFTPHNSQKYTEYGHRTGKVPGRPFVPEDLMDKDRIEVVITGQLTLAEAAQITGIPPEDIIEKMNLPSGTSHDETLGQLRKKHGFTLAKFREILTALMNRPQAKEAPVQSMDEAKTQAQERAPLKAKQLPEAEHERDLTQGSQGEDTSGILITGRMTLRELEDQTGIPARTIAGTLGLPSSVSIDEHLGRLRRLYGFTMQELRDTVSSLLMK